MMYMWIVFDGLLVVARRLFAFQRAVTMMAFTYLSNDDDAMMAGKSFAIQPLRVIVGSVCLMNNSLRCDYRAAPGPPDRAARALRVGSPATADVGGEL
jgi:hypothetical protein